MAMSNNAAHEKNRMKCTGYIFWRETMVELGGTIEQSISLSVTCISRYIDIYIKMNIIIPDKLVVKF